MKIKDLIVRYGAITRRRFNKKDKIRFSSGISQEFSELGYDVTLKSGENNRLFGYNLVIGDPTKAKVVVATPMDTPIKSFFPYQPDTYAGHKMKSLVNTLVPFVIMVVGIVLMYLFFLNPITSDSVFNYLDVLVWFLIAMFVVFVIRYSKGIPNKNNLNSNSSGLIGALLIANDLSRKERKQVSFVFTDMNFVNGFGYDMLKQVINPHAHVIIIESIGSNEELYVLGDQSKQQLFEANGFKYDSKNDSDSKCNLFNHCNHIFRAQKTNEKFVVKNAQTSKDTEIDEERLQQAVDSTLSVIKKLLNR